MWRLLSDATAVLSITIALASVVKSDNSTKPAVYFSLIYSGGEYGHNSTGVIPAIELALEAVRNQALLPNYTLTYETPRNSKCSHRNSLGAFFRDFVRSSRPKIALVGCGCSDATLSVAEISHEWNISQIAFGSSSEELNDRSRFPSFFRTIPSTGTFPPILLSLCRHFKWRRLALISERDNIAHKEKNEFHVFFLSCYTFNAREVMCEAAKRGMVYPSYGWIILSTYPDDWWLERNARRNPGNCTDQQLKDFLSKSRPLVMNFRTKPDRFNDTHKTTVAGISKMRFEELYRKKLNETNYLHSLFHLSAFDAVWTVAQVLYYTEEMRQNNLSGEDTGPVNCTNLPGELVPLNKFNYSNAFMGCVMRNNYYKVNFTGVSGDITYDGNGTVVKDRVTLHQIRNVIGNLLRVKFGSILINSSNHWPGPIIYTDDESDESVYPNGFPPDGTPIEIIYTYHIALISLYYIVAVGGVTLSAFLLIINFIFRKKKIVQLTTPTLNYAISIGALLLYISVIFDLLPTSEQEVLLAKYIMNEWTFITGYFLMYGAILTKMWRIYHIFHNPTAKKIVCKTWYLLCGSLGITAVGMVLLLPKTISDIRNYRVEENLVNYYNNSNGSETSHLQENIYVWKYKSSSQLTVGLLVILIIYIGLLQFLGIILAFQNRHIRVTVLNESKAVTALVYISSIAVLLLVIIGIIKNDNNGSIALILDRPLSSAVMIILATSFLVLNFAPKMYAYYRDLTGEKIFSSSHITNTASNRDEQQRIALSLSDLTDSERIRLLTTRVDTLEEIIRERRYLH